MIKSKIRPFLEAYAKTGAITTAAAQVGISRDSVTWRRDHDPEFAAALARAHDEAVEFMEHEIRRRGMVGYDKGVWHNGQKVGTERVYSDLAAIAWLRGHCPERYARDERVTISGTVQHQHQHVALQAVQVLLGPAGLDGPPAMQPALPEPLVPSSDTGEGQANKTEYYIEPDTQQS